MTEIAINDLTPRNRYVAAGGETELDYDFSIFDADDITVQETDPDDLNNPVTLVRGTDYTVTGVNVATGGTIVFDVTAYPSGAVADNIYTIVRAVPYERLNDYQFSGDFESSDINSDLDRVVMMIQQLDLRLNATVQLDKTDALTSLPITIEATADRQNRAFIFNAAGTALKAGPTANEITSAQGYATSASASATAAASSASDAAATLAQVQAIYDNFDDRYLGAKASDPSVDNDGDPLVDGALYFNTTSNLMRIYDLGNTTWNDVTTSLLDGSVTTAKIADSAVTTAKINDGAVTNAKLANVATSTIKGRTTAGTGDTEDLTPTQARSVMNVYSTTETDAAISAAAPDTNQMAKAWVNFNGTGTVAVRDSYNVSSITDTGTGKYTVNFTNGFDNANYVGVVTCGDPDLTNWNAYGTFPVKAAPTTTEAPIGTHADSNVALDAEYVSAVFYGDIT